MMQSGAMDDSHYAGSELDLFSQAHNWKGYWRRQVAPYLSGKVMEVGAGIGGTTAKLLDLRPVDAWFCLEPDPALADRIPSSVAACLQKDRLQVLPCYLGAVREAHRGSCDAVLYIDVIEHIEDDAAELATAADVLKPGGFLVILVPAHALLFSNFDRAIGHFRRYDRRLLLQALPAGMTVQRHRDLDCVGFCASLANRLFLRQSYPSPRQIALWDRWMVPVSRCLDRCFCYRLGKSLLLVAQKSPGSAP